MRALGITSFFISCLLILLCAFIALINGKRNSEVALIPISFLLLQTWFLGYYLQKTSRGTISGENLIVDEPDEVQIKMPRFYKISAVILTLVLLFAMVSILNVTIFAMNGYSIYGKTIMGVIGLACLFISIFNILSAFRKFRIRATQEA